MKLDYGAYTMTNLMHTCLFYNTSIHYYIPPHVSSITYANRQEVFNCIDAASGIIV